jgi:hypothetical protein
MAKPTSLMKWKDSVHLVPQAIFSVPVREIAKRFDAEIEVGYDDLDHFEGVAFISELGWRFALIHYAGYPEGTSTIYLPDKFSDVEKITEMVAAIRKEFDLSPKQLQWQRLDDPEL